MKRTFIPLLLCLAFGLILAACGGNDPSTNTSVSSNTANTTTATSNKGNPPANTTTSTTTTSGGEKIGVAECDELITKYEACVNSKVPEAQRAQYKPTLDQWRSSWKTLANNPQTKTTLAGVCKSALDQAKTSMKSYGCEF